MAFREILAQRYTGLVILAVAAVALGLTAGFTAGVANAEDAAQKAQVPQTPQQSTKTVTEIRIDDDGVRVGDTRIEPGEGVVRQGETEIDWGSGDTVRMRVHGEDVVRFGDDVIIDEGEVVQGDAVSILGSVLVNGIVEGDAVAVAGGLTVGPRGRVDGDGVAIGGGVTKEPGAVIRGEMVSIGKGGNWVTEGHGGVKHVFGPRTHFGPFGPFGIFSRAGRLFIFIVWTLFVILLGLIVVAVARRHVENVCVTAKKETFKMGLIGLLTEVLLVPVIGLFCITIIGIPIGLVVVPMLFTLAMLLGYTGVGLAVGERFTGGNGKSVYWSAAMGILLLQATWIVSAIVRLPGGILGSIGWVIAFLAWAVIYVAVTVGLGAVVMTRFGTRLPHAVAPAPQYIAAPAPPPPAAPAS
jgi:hypothetical protein